MAPVPAADARAARDRAHRRHGRPGRAADREGLRLPGVRRQRLLPRAALRGVRQAVASAARRHGGGRGDRSRQGGRSRLRALEGSQAGRADVGQPVGPGATRLAPRVLGHGGALPGRGTRHPWRRHRPDLPAPRERDRAVGGRHRSALREPLGAQRDDHLGHRKDVQVAGQHPVDPRGGEAGARRGPATALSRHALPHAARLLRGTPRGGAGGGHATLRDACPRRRGRGPPRPHHRPRLCARRRADTLPVGVLRGDGRRPERREGDGARVRSHSRPEPRPRRRRPRCGCGHPRGAHSYRAGARRHDCARARSSRTCVRGAGLAPA